MLTEIARQHSFEIDRRNGLTPNGTVSVPAPETISKETTVVKNSRYAVGQFVFETGLELVELGSDVKPKLHIPRSDKGGHAPSMIDKKGNKVQNPYLSDHSALRLSKEDQIIFSVVEDEHTNAKKEGMIGAESAVRLTIIKRKPSVEITVAEGSKVFNILQVAKRRLAKIEHGGVALCRGEIDLSKIKIISPQELL